MNDSATSLLSLYTKEMESNMEKIITVQHLLSIISNDQVIQASYCSPRNECLIKMHCVHRVVNSKILSIF